MGLFGGGNQDASVHISNVQDSQNTNIDSTTALSDIGNVTIGDGRDTPAVATIKAIAPLVIIGALGFGAITIFRGK